MRKIKIVAFLIAFVMCFSAFAACSKAKLSGIEVTTKPDKIEYTVGEAFDKTGMAVTANYADGTFKVLADNEYKISNTKALKLTDKEIKVTYKGKSAVVPIAVFAPVTYGAETENDIKDLVGSLLDMILAVAPPPEEGESQPKWVQDILDAAGDNFVDALKQARITEDDVKGLIEFIEAVQSFDIMNSMADPSFVQDLIDAFYATGIDNTKLARFIWAFVNIYRDAVNTALTEIFVGDKKDEAKAAAVAGVAEYMSYYDAVIGLGEREFVLIFKTVMDLAVLGASPIVSIAKVAGGIPTLNEFKDLVFALRGDMLKALGILGAEEITAFCNLAKIFLPFAAGVIDDEYYQNEIDRLEDDIIFLEEDLPFFQSEIDKFTGLLSTETDEGLIEEYEAKLAYWQEEKANNEKWIADDEAKIAHMKSLQGKDNSGTVVEYANTLIDMFAADYAKLVVSLKAGLNAIDDKMLDALYNVIFNTHNIDTVVLIVAKIFDAALNADGGLTLETAKELFPLYFNAAKNLVNMLQGYISPAEAADILKDNPETIEQFYADLAKLAKLTKLSYNVVLGEAYEDNLAVIIIMEIIARGGAK